MSESSGPLYPNQPLEEVAAEIRFQGRVRVEHARADFHDEIVDKYSKLLVPRVVANVAPATQHYRFESADQACGVQLAVNSLMVYAREYPGFQPFFAEVSRIAGIFFRLVGPVNVTRIGWRYVNAIPFPKHEGRLPFEQIFQRQPWLAAAIEGEWSVLASTGRMPFRDAMINLRLEAGAEDSTSKLETLVYDIDAFSLSDPARLCTGAEECLGVLSKMHDAAREVFELSINEQYRKFLLGDAA